MVPGRRGAASSRRLATPRRPLRVFGRWAGLPGLPEQALPVDDEEPVAALTLGRPRLNRLLPFLRSTAAAEAEVVDAPGLLASTGLARPPTSSPPSRSGAPPAR